MVASVALFAGIASGQANVSRFEIGPVFSLYHKGQGGITPPDWSQLGGRLTWNCLPHLSVEAEFDSTLRPSLSGDDESGGYFSQALLGVTSGIHWKNWGLVAKFRPGFIHYSTVITSVRGTTTRFSFGFGSLTDPAFDLGGGAEFFLSRHFLFRYDVSDLIVHQGARTLVQFGQPFTELSFTQNHFEAEAAFAFRF